MIKYFKMIIIGIIVSFSITACSTQRVVVTDNRIMAHWMEYGEKAPYDGVLLNKFTYENLLDRALKCSKKKKSN